MPKQLLPLTVSAPGFYGLNTQQSGSILPPGWATKLDNFVFDNVGRIASRQGSQQLNSSAQSGTPTNRTIHEYIDASGASLNIFAGGNKLWKEVSGTITDITGTATTPTGDNWQFANFNGWCVGYQDGHEPIFLETTASNFIDAADFGGAASKTMYDGAMVISAFGRTWTVYNNTLYYSDLLIHSYAGGSSGNFDLAKFWPNGMDEAVAIAVLENNLVVFGKQSLILYQNADEVSNMSIVGGLDGVGCIARDSIQMIGSDLVFLSDSGLRTLSRAIVEGSLPLSDISRHVRGDLINGALNETAANIKSVYNPKQGFYLLSLPTTGQSWCFDLKFPNEDGSWKSSTWDIAPTGLMYSQDDTMYLSLTDGYLSKYTGYAHEADSTGLNGTAYTLNYEGVWNDFGVDFSNFLKILKNVSLLGSGTPSSSIAFKWAVDYESTFHTRNLTFNQTAPATYGTAKYDVDTFAASGSFERIRSPLSKAGQVILYGFTTNINGYEFALQRLDILAKIGRLKI